MILDFNEIPRANSAGGLQDTFELFSRDFLEYIGFEILHHPDRGPDGKKDLIVKEDRIGIGGITTIKWLVSCKHYAHSKRSVSDTDEPDIIDRLRAHDCQGFIGVYSTLPQTTLNDKLHKFIPKIQFQIYDKERIEKELLEHPNGIKLARRYFPISIEKFINQNPKPKKIFKEIPAINCENCQSDLLINKNGIFVLLKETNDPITNELRFKNQEIKYAYFSCKGDCDNKLKSKYIEQGLLSSEWGIIDDLMIPTLFLNNIVAYINRLMEHTVSQEAHEQMKQLYINVFPHIIRELTHEEKERVSNLIQFDLF